MSERLQKFLARAGVASRRHAEGLITAGRVQVNNQRVTELGSKVEPGDLVTVDGALVSVPETTSWYLLNKPPGVVTTLSDPEGRPTVAELLGEVPTRVFPVGRLDWDAEGALLFTNDGEAAHRLLHPSFEVRRTYLVKVKGAPTDETLQRLCQGVRLEDGPARALRAERFEAAERNTWLVLEVGEGRPHLVKRLCAAIGHPVLRLFRPAQGGISVAAMAAGEVRELTAEEIASVQSVVAGTPVPEPALFLPPRRHGRAGDQDEAVADEEARPAPMPPAPESGADRRGGVGPGASRERNGRAQTGGTGPRRGEGRHTGRAPTAAGSGGRARIGPPRDRPSFRGGGRSGGPPAGREFGGSRKLASAPAGEPRFDRARAARDGKRFGRADRSGEGGPRSGAAFGAPRGRTGAPAGERGFDRARPGRDEKRFNRAGEGGRRAGRAFGTSRGRTGAPAGERGFDRARPGRDEKRFDRPSSRQGRGLERRFGGPPGAAPRPGERPRGRFGALPRHRSGRAGGHGAAGPGDTRPTDRRGRAGGDRRHDRGGRPRGPPPGGRGGTRPGSGRGPRPRR